MEAQAPPVPGNPRGCGRPSRRFGKREAIRSLILTGKVELFDMSNDLAEKRDYAQRRPDLARHAPNLLNAGRSADEAHTPPRDDGD